MKLELTVYPGDLRHLEAAEPRRGAAAEGRGVHLIHTISVKPRRGTRLAGSMRTDKENPG